ncbi:DNA-binding LytR/AlgR family response regulator [Aquimarina sp. EL_43]|uniref:LytR/AlgR family response regulator transcription factor n=1 Tax=unclassified Aquimarina TaxID=2627091 RepID=UPI0018CB218B|nr:MULTISPECIES: LytTR family DNA-binding domain-containing protein [unclassified Aquimarina]MBG6129452.1 DNA-binding LytR/AlgR family response regulator [Aquimarina sp. EL_35]MBG6150517.1 DNA-binding LytR/AlgR family response regulator [Aquimarina sp. EL_32]MBG6168175.1 DNA-binding LytR/AlgR family response regulator [Aquimarina sp. EL_43]
MVRCLLVDDESPAIDLLKNHIKMLDDLEIVTSCYSAVEAFEVIKKEEIDLLFLDIEMPVLKGLDFLKTLQHPPKVIITTAYREYAIEGYDLDIIDYLLKPISFDRFVKAIDRYYERVQSSPLAIVEKSDTFFYVNVNKKHIKIIFDEVLYIESLKDYVKIHTIHQKLVVKSNIGKIETQLPSSLFLRTHRSYIVAIDKITAYTQKDIEIDTIEIPIGSSYSNKVFSLLSHT